MQDITVDKRIHNVHVQLKSVRDITVDKTIHNFHVQFKICTRHNSRQSNSHKSQLSCNIKRGYYKTLPMFMGILWELYY